MRITTFASGSSGNCTLVSGCGSHILIDAGISMKRIKAALALSGLRPEDISGILVTHEHSDHISGIAMLNKTCRIPIFAPRTVAEHLRYAVAGVEESLHIIPVGERFALGPLTVTAFRTPHDTAESVGYRIEGDGIFAFATDTGHISEEMERGLTGADAVIIEANHDVDMLMDGPYPAYLKKRILSADGHLSNADCGVLARRLAESGTRSILLGHLSRENNTPSVAYEAVHAALCGMEQVFLAVVPAAERMTLEFERKEVCSP